MKKVIKSIAVMLVVALLLPSLSVFATQAMWQDSGRVTVNSAEIPLSMGLIPDDNDIRIPSVSLADGLGYSIEYSKSERTITITGNTHTAILYYDSCIFTLDEKSYVWEDEPLRIEDRGSYVSAAWFATAFVITYDIDYSNYKVNFNTRGTGTAALDRLAESNTYNAMYYNNGGKGAPAVQTNNYGIDLVISATTPSRIGYTFDGWGLTSYGLKPCISLILFTRITPISICTLYGQSKR